MGRPPMHTAGDWQHAAEVEAKGPSYARTLACCRLAVGGLEVAQNLVAAFDGCIQSFLGALLA